MADTNANSYGNSRNSIGSDDLRERANNMKEQVSDMGRMAKDAASEQLNRARDIASEQISRARDVASDQLSRIQEVSQDQLDQVAVTIRERPFTALGIAAGVGLFLGMMIRGSSSSRY